MWLVKDMTQWSVGALALIGLGFIAYYHWGLFLLIPAAIAAFYAALILGSFLCGMAGELWRSFRKRRQG